jgi:spermidine/putrescine transport system substrate-binding protein
MKNFTLKILPLTAAFLASTTALYAEGELNALIWCDHADAALLEPFEKKYDVRVNVKEYEGTAAGLAILDQSRPGDWDVLVIDGVDVARATDLNLLAPLPADQLPTASFFPEVVMAENNIVNGVQYAVTEKFGYNTIAYDKTKVDPGDLESMSGLWLEKYSGRIGIYDYYLPMIGMVGLEQGINTAELSADSVESLRERLYALKDASKQVGEVISSQTALATGEIDILFGGGEWLTAVVATENPNLDWTIPKEGAVRWAQSIAVLADSERKDLALEFVKYVTSPEGQARLATSSCYWGMPANAEAGQLLTDDQKAILRWDQQAEYLQKTQLYPVPDAELDRAMQDLWTDMIQH